MKPISETGFIVWFRRESMASISIREVAARAGVSRATVSRVLNGNTEALVAEPTRSRVRQVAIELGYHPSAVARGLAGKPMNTVGVVMAYDLPSVTSDPFLGPVLDGILEANKRHHQKTVLFTEDNWQSAFANLPIYCDGHCDGLLLIAPRTDSEIIPALLRGSRPFLLLGDSREVPGLSCVDIDNGNIAREVVEHLIAQGHRRIAIFCGNADFTSSAQRLQGYRDALEASGLPYDESLVFPGEYWEWSGYENAEKLLRLPAEQRPTALFCSNGRIALGALRALTDRGVLVPQELSLACLGDNMEIASTQPPLTAAHVSLRQVGERAVETLLGQIHAGLPSGSRTLLPAELVLRESVAPPPSR
jgi:LacI family transcriptional regulator